jgi:hypothetical protein
MGTRGLWGYAIDGATKTTYNHYDSYPSGLGQTVLEHARWCAENLDAAREQALALRVVGEGDDKPTPEDVEHLRPWTDLGVASRSTDDWYCLLRQTQGSPTEALKAGVMLSDRGFAADSLFCEYGYIVDLDGQQFEVYEGFQHAPHSDGRFAQMGVRPTAVSGDYYPIRLVASYPFDALPDDLAALEGDDR